MIHLFLIFSLLISKGILPSIYFSTIFEQQAFMELWELLSYPTFLISIIPNISIHPDHNYHHPTTFCEAISQN